MEYDLNLLFYILCVQIPEIGPDRHSVAGHWLHRGKNSVHFIDGRFDISGITLGVNRRDYLSAKTQDIDRIIIHIFQIIR